MVAWSFGLLVFVLFIFFASIPVWIHCFFSPLPKMNWVRDSWGIWQFLQLADRKVTVMPPKKCEWTAAAVMKKWRSYMKSICSSEREQENNCWGREVMQWHLWTEKEKGNISSAFLNTSVDLYLEWFYWMKICLNVGLNVVSCSAGWCVMVWRSCTLSILGLVSVLNSFDEFINTPDSVPSLLICSFSHMM